MEGWLVCPGLDMARPGPVQVRELGGLDPALCNQQRRKPAPGQAEPGSAPVYGSTRLPMNVTSDACSELPSMLSDFSIINPWHISIILFCFLFMVYFSSCGFLRCWLIRCSIAPGEPRRHGSVPSIVALVALISRPSSTRAHA